jgi:hypothetical protein
MSTLWVSPVPLSTDSSPSVALSTGYPVDPVDTSSTDAPYPTATSSYTEPYVTGVEESPVLLSTDYPTSTPYVTGVEESPVLLSTGYESAAVPTTFATSTTKKHGGSGKKGPKPTKSFDFELPTALPDVARWFESGVKGKGF